MRHTAHLLLGLIAICGMTAAARAQPTQTPNAETMSKCIAVSGAVRAPGRVALRERIRMSEALTMAGGFTDQVGRTISIIFAAARCTDELRNTSAKPLPTPILRVYQIAGIHSDDETRNPYLQPGDLVVVNEADCVYIVGSVLQPRQMLLDGRVTLTQAIAFAGGLTRDAKNDKVRIIRQADNSSEKTELIFNLAQIRKKKAQDPVLQPYDIIEVPSLSPHLGDRLMADL